MGNKYGLSDEYIDECIEKGVSVTVPIVPDNVSGSVFNACIQLDDYGRTSMGVYGVDQVKLSVDDLIAMRRFGNG